MLKIEEPTLMNSATRCFEMSVERPRKYPAGLPIRLAVRCKECSRHCTIDLRLPEPFPSACVAVIEDVFSSLCEKLAVEVATAELVGQRNLSSDASEV